MIPGANVLNMALRVIAPQTVQWYPAQTRTLNSIGLWVVTYASPITVRGSFQPVARDKFENLGLEFNKSYVQFFVSANMLDVERDISGDQFVYAGDRYQVLSNTEWLNVDGWQSSMAVKITQ